MLQDLAPFCSTVLLYALAIAATEIDRTAATSVVIPDRRNILSERLSERIAEISATEAATGQARQALVTVDVAEVRAKND